MKRTAIKPETSFADELIRGLESFVDATRKGEPITIRSVDLRLSPRAYRAMDVKRLRAALGVSQAVFAQAMAVSTVLVQKWEAGTRQPQPVHCRLMDEIARDPKAWLARLFTEAKASGKRRPAKVRA